MSGRSTSRGSAGGGSGPGRMLMVAAVGIGTLVSWGCAGEGARSGPPVIRPGAPGQPSTRLDLDETMATDPGVTQADVRFMQGMIAHHAQALTMSRLVPQRAENEDVLLLARRIERSQGDEIALMDRWLREHGKEAPDPALGYRLPSAPDRPIEMPGMLTEAELSELSEASGEDFERLFLVHMIRHHEGALVMVRELFSSEGAGRESDIFQFASEVDSDQRIEIARMVRILGGTP